MFACFLRSGWVYVKDWVLIWGWELGTEGVSSNDTVDALTPCMILR